jgi:hypothetical protein
MIQDMLEIIYSNILRVLDNFHMINASNLFYFDMYESHQFQFLLRNHPSGLNTNFEM